LLTDDVDEAMNHIQQYAVEKYQLKERKTIKPFWLFNEKKLDN
jgi:hypothetical protein